MGIARALVIKFFGVSAEELVLARPFFARDGYVVVGQKKCRYSSYVDDQIIHPRKG